ncbi:Wzz/FepE/Etk N-terminal domain-containing protein [Thiomicrospira pelophila]|uniref:Wzz/FepE/Etk N-terminal domain-containing protein n=1 Tax=Thiomicrospira pelophila TaxID=934 RepID=UPI0004A78364|nr:Wzz/FepE/Etk N-terminal domain-containing protein [Thiomicrospira pelophila]
MQNQQPMNYQDDEIDLFELFQTLWQQKWLILATTLIAPILAFVFTVSQPVKPDTFQGKALIEIGAYASHDGVIHTIERPEDLSLIISKQFNAETNVPRTSVKVLEIETSSIDKESSADKLQEAIDFVLQRHEKFTSSKLKENVIQPTQVVGQASVERVSPKDKLKLILAVAFVLGCMLGVFIALIRSAIRKRKLQTAAI